MSEGAKEMAGRHFLRPTGFSSESGSVLPVSAVVKGLEPGARLAYM